MYVSSLSFVYHCFSIANIDTVNGEWLQLEDFSGNFMILLRKFSINYLSLDIVNNFLFHGRNVSLKQMRSLTLEQTDF